MTFDMFLLSLTQAAELNNFIGGSLSGFLYFTFATVAVVIPSAIWPNKPVFEDLGQNIINLLRTVLSQSVMQLLSLDLVINSLI